MNCELKSLPEVSANVNPARTWVKIALQIGDEPPREATLFIEPCEAEYLAEVLKLVVEAPLEIVK